MDAVSATTARAKRPQMHAAFEQLLAVLDAVHSAGLVHNDIARQHAITPPLWRWGVYRFWGEREAARRTACQRGYSLVEHCSLRTASRVFV